MESDTLELYAIGEQSGRFISDLIEEAVRQGTMKKVTLRQVPALVAIDLPDGLRQPGFAPHEERVLYEIVEDTDD